LALFEQLILNYLDGVITNC